MGTWAPVRISLVMPLAHCVWAFFSIPFSCTPWEAAGDGKVVERQEGRDSELFHLLDHRAGQPGARSVELYLGTPHMWRKQQDQFGLGAEQLRLKSKWDVCVVSSGLTHMADLDGIPSS